MFERIQREPVAFWGLLTVLLEALLAMALLFGWLDWTTEQIGGVLAVVAAVGAIFTFLARAQVTPTADPHLNVPAVLEGFEVPDTD